MERKETNRIEIKKLRQEIDAIINKAKENYKEESRLPHATYTEEMRITIIKLKEAKMWLGKCLESLGYELPEEFQDKAEE
jgi:hypothetical protein